MGFGLRRSGTFGLIILLICAFGYVGVWFVVTNKLREEVLRFVDDKENREHVRSEFESLVPRNFSLHPGVTLNKVKFYTEDGLVSDTEASFERVTVSYSFFDNSVTVDFGKDFEVHSSSNKGSDLPDVRSSGNLKISCSFIHGSELKLSLNRNFLVMKEDDKGLMNIGNIRYSNNGFNCNGVAEGSGGRGFPLTINADGNYSLGLGVVRGLTQSDVGVSSSESGVDYGNYFVENKIVANFDMLKYNFMDKNDVIPRVVADLVWVSHQKSAFYPMSVRVNNFVMQSDKYEIRANGYLSNMRVLEGKFDGNVKVNIHAYDVFIRNQLVSYPQEVRETVFESMKKVILDATDKDCKQGNDCNDIEFVIGSKDGKVMLGKTEIGVFFTKIFESLLVIDPLKDSGGSGKIVGKNDGVGSTMPSQNGSTTMSGQNGSTSKGS